MRPNGTPPTGLGDEVFERDICTLAAMAADDLVADNDADMQRVDQDTMGRALARKHLGERHLCRPADRGRRAVGTARLGADVEGAALSSAERRGGTSGSGRKA